MMNRIPLSLNEKVALATTLREGNNPIFAAERRLAQAVLDLAADFVEANQRAEKAEALLINPPRTPERMDDPVRPVRYRVYRDEAYAPTNAEARLLLERLAAVELERDRSLARVQSERDAAREALLRIAETNGDEAQEWVRKFARAALAAAETETRAVCPRCGGKGGHYFGCTFDFESISNG